MSISMVYMPCMLHASPFLLFIKKKKKTILVTLGREMIITLLMVSKTRLIKEPKNGIVLSFY